MQGASNGRHRRAHPSAQSNPSGSTDPRNAGRARRTAAARSANARAIPFAGFRAGEIIAPRVWTAYGGLLHSVFFLGHPWLPHFPVQGDPHTHGSGIHAFKTLDEAHCYADKARHWIFPGWNVVVGRAALWGDVVEHEHGYRAEFGAVHSLLAVLHGNVDIASLRADYGCERAD
jgi:hypothetical protein